MKAKFLFIAAILFTLVGCSNNTIFEEAKQLPTEGWAKEDRVSFDFEATDTTGVYNIIIDIRNEAQYAYKNFWLFVQSTSPDGVSYSDTLECVLADNYGKWIGKSSGSMYALPVYLLQNVSFPKMGTYHFDLIQGMREDTLKHIHEIGMHIQKVDIDKSEK